MQRSKTELCHMNIKTQWNTYESCLSILFKIKQSLF